MNSKSVHLIMLVFYLSISHATQIVGADQSIAYQKIACGLQQNISEALFQGISKDLYQKIIKPFMQASCGNILAEKIVSLDSYKSLPSSIWFFEKNTVASNFFPIGQFACTALSKQLSLLDQLFSFKNIVISFANKIVEDKDYEAVVTKKLQLLSLPVESTSLAGFTIEADVELSVPHTETLLQLVQLHQSRMRIHIPLNAQTYKDIKISFVKRNKENTTIQLGKILGDYLPTGSLTNDIKSLVVGVVDTDYHLQDDGLRIRILGTVSFMGKNAQALISFKLSGNGFSAFALAIKPTSVDGINFSRLIPDFNVLDKQMQLQAFSCVVSQEAITDTAFLQFAAATPEDIRIIKKGLVHAQDRAEEPTSELTLDDLVGFDEENQNPAKPTIDSNSAKSEESETPSSSSAEVDQEMTAQVLLANMHAALGSLQPGLTIITDVGATSGGLLEKSLQAIGLQSLRVIMFAPKGVRLDQLKNPIERKKLQIKAVFMQEPAQGLCLLKSLEPLIEAAGVSDTHIKPIADIFKLVCFGTDIGFSFNEDMEPQFFIAGALKSGGIKAMIKTRLSGDKKYVTLAWQGVKQGFTFGSLQNELAGLDKLLHIKNLTIVASTDPQTSAFDIRNNAIDVTAPGALLNLAAGMTILAEVNVTDAATAKLLSTAGLQKVQVKVFIPQGAKKPSDTQVNFVSATEGAPAKVCINDLIPNLGLPSNDFIKALFVCASDAKAELFYANAKISANYAGTLSVAGVKLPFEIRATKTTGQQAVPAYAALFSPADGFAFKSISSDLAVLDDQVTLKGIKIALANQDVDTSLGEVDSLQAGLTLAAEADFKGLVGNVTDELSLTGVAVVYHLPKGAQSFKDGILQLKPKTESDKGLCIAKPVTELLDLMQIAVVPGLKDILKSVCFNTTMGITRKDDAINFFIGGPLKEPSLQALLKLSSKVVKASDGKISADTSELNKSRFALGVRYGKPLAMASIDSSLKFLDDLVTLANPLIMAANYDNATLFDIDSPDLPSELKVAQNLDKGITVLADTQLKGDLGDVAGLINAKNLRMTVYVPIKSTTNKDIKVRLEQIPGKDDEQTVCLKKLAANIPGSEAFIKAIGGSGDLCITKNKLAIMPDPSGALTIEIDGSVAVGGKTLNATLFITKSPSTAKPKVAIAVASSDDLTFGGDLGKVGMFTELATFKKPLFLLSNFSAPQKLVGADPTGARAELTIDPGISIQSNMEFKGIYAEPFKFFGIGDFDATIVIPADLANAEGYYIKAAKEIDRSLEALNLKKFTLAVQGGTPPSIELDLDTLANLGNLRPAGLTTTDGKVALTLGVAFDKTAFSLLGKLACQDKACPTIQPIPGLPLRLDSTQRVPLSIKLNFVGGALSGIGGSGNLKFGDDYITVLFDGNPGANKYAAKGNFNKLCLLDSIKFAELVVDKLGIPTITLPDILCLNNVSFSVNPTKEGVVVADSIIETGFDIHGNMNLLGATGKLDMHVKSPNLASALTDVSQIGIDASGSLSPIKIGSVFGLTDAQDANKGPSVSVALTTAKQEIGLSGKLTLLDGLIKSQAYLKIDTTGVNASFNQALAGLAFDMQLQGAVADLQAGKLDAFKLTGKATNDLSSSINNVLRDVVKTVVGQALAGEQEAVKICEQLFGYLQVINVDCKNCIGSATGANAIDAIVDNILKTIQMSVDDIQFSMSLGDLTKGKVLKLAVDLAIAGAKTKTVVDLDITKPQNIVRAIVKGAFASIFNVGGAVADALKNIVSDISFKCSSSAKIGNSSAAAISYIKPVSPQSSYVEITAPQVAVTDLIQAADKIINKTSNGAISLPTIPSTLAPLALKNFNLNISTFSSRFTGELDVLGQKAIAASGRISASGFSLQAALAPINQNVLSITAAGDTSQGPKLSIDVDKDKFEALVTGSLSIGGILQGQVVIDLTTTPQIKLSSKMLGVATDLTITGFDFTTGNLSQAGVVMKLNAADLTSAVQTAKAAAINTINKPFNEAQSKMNEAENKVNNIPVAGCLASGVLDAAKGVFSGIQSLVNSAINAITGFGVNTVEFDGTLGSFKLDNGALTVPKAAINFTLAGVQSTLALTNINFKSPDALVALVFSSVDKLNADKIAGQVLDKLKDLGSATENVGKAIGEALANTAKCLGNQLGEAFKKGIDEVEKLGDEALKGLENLGGDIEKGMKDAAGAVDKATQAAEKAITDATKAVAAAVDAAAQAVGEAIEAATQAVAAAAQAAAKALEQAAQAVEKAIAHAAQEAERAVAQAAREVAHYADPRNWF